MNTLKLISNDQYISPEILEALHKRDQLREQLAVNIHQLKSLVGLEDQDSKARGIKTMNNLETTLNNKSTNDIKPKAGTRYLVPLLAILGIGGLVYFRFKRAKKLSAVPGKHLFQGYSQPAKHSSMKKLLSSAFLQALETAVPAVATLVLEKYLSSAASRSNNKQNAHTHAKDETYSDQHAFH